MTHVGVEIKESFQVSGVDDKQTNRIEGSTESARAAAPTWCFFCEPAKSWKQRPIWELRINRSLSPSTAAQIDERQGGKAPWIQHDWVLWVRAAKNRKSKMLFNSLSSSYLCEVIWWRRKETGIWACIVLCLYLNGALYWSSHSCVSAPFSFTTQFITKINIAYWIPIQG